MSVRKLTASLLAALAMLGSMAASDAQQYIPPADPFQFDPDFQWFKPVYDMDLADMTAKQRAPVGWFATYDRLNLHGSRPDLFQAGRSVSTLDNGWGHRYQIGYMLPGEDKGWTFTSIESNVGELFKVRQERLNRINVQELDGTPIVAGPPFGEIVRREEGNNIGYNFRFYDVTTTLNQFKLNSYALNKTWRLEPYHYGGILEPMVGMRWMRLKDINAFQTYNHSLTPVRFFAPTEDPTTFLLGEQLVTNTALTNNEMFGGQFGARYFKTQNRFTYSGQFEVFFGGNWQHTQSTQSTEVTAYTDAGTDEDVVYITSTETDPFYSNNEEFFFGYDLRTQLAYQVTSGFTIRGGVQLIHIAKGVWRGGDGRFVVGGENDQDVVMVGGTFGAALNY